MILDNSVLQISCPGCGDKIAGATAGFEAFSDVAKVHFLERCEVVKEAVRLHGWTKDEIGLEFETSIGNMRAAFEAEVVKRDPQLRVLGAIRELGENIAKQRFAQDVPIKLEGAIFKADEDLDYLLRKIAGLLTRSILPREKIVTVTRDGQGNITGIAVREEIKG